MVASNQRPIPLMRRADLQVANIDYLGVGYQVIKDPVGLKYHRLQVEQYSILELLNGERSLEQVRDDLKIQFPTLQVTLGDIQQLITDLHKKGLVVSNRPGQGGAMVRERRKETKQKIKQTLMSLMYLRLPGWDPERTLRWMYPYLKFLFWKPVVAGCMVFVVLAWLLLAANLDEFHSRLPEFQSFFGWPNLIYLWATLGIAKIIHEFGHGLSCHHYGGECHEMGVMLLVFSPCLYCDVTDSWMMKNKWHRIIIGAAGMYIEVILSGIAIFTWWFTRPGMVQHLALNVFFVTTITTVIFNANPLMRFDGYYMMSDFLEIPNLRAKSDKLLREAFSWYCLGIESRPDPFMPETGRAWFITYAIAAWCYRWVILVSISMFLYTVLKPYDLQSIGITLMVFSMSGIVFAMFRNVYQIIMTPRLEPMSKPKMLISGLIAGTLGWLAFSIPIPWHHEAPFFIEPKNVVHVTSPFNGQVLSPEDYRKLYEQLQQGQQEIFGWIRWPVVEEHYGQREIDLIGDLPAPEQYDRIIQPGETIEKGQILTIIEDATLLSNIDDLLKAARSWSAQLNAAYAYQASEGDVGKDMSAQIEEAKSEMIVLSRRIAELVRLNATRVIRANRSGTVVAAKRVPEPQRDEINYTKLNRWHGTPLDAENNDCFVEQGAELLSIAPTDQIQAVMYIDQADRDDLADQMEVELKLDHLPWVTYKAPVTVVSPKGEKVAPEALTTKYGGSLATRPDQQGQETLASTAYRATVEMHFVHDSSKEDSVLIKPGMRGNARFLVSHRTVAGWIRRYLNETFRFRL